MIRGTVRPSRHRSAARVSRGLPARTSGRWGGDERWEGGCTDARSRCASQQGLRGPHPHEKEGTEGHAGHRGHVVGARQGHGAHAPGVCCRGRSTRLRTPPSQPMSVVLPTRATPWADGFVGHHDAACAQELFHVAGAQGEARGEPDPVADDVTRKAVVLVTFGVCGWPKDATPCLRPPFSIAVRSNRRLQVAHERTTWQSVAGPTCHRTDTGHDVRVRTKR